MACATDLTKQMGTNDVCFFYDSLLLTGKDYI